MEQSKDYFVVVQTKEAGKHVLSAVPCRWVRDGYLFWPGKNVNKLRTNLKSEPCTSWSKIVCNVKRKYIPSYEEAEMEAAELSGQNTESSDAAPRKKKQKKTMKDGSSQRFDFNHLVPADGNHSTSSTVSGTESNTVNQSIVNDSQNHPEPSHNLLCSASMNPVNNVATQLASEQPVFVTTVPVSEEGQSVLDGNQAITTEGEYMYYQQEPIDVDYIVKPVTEKIEYECSKMKQEISAVGTMMASFKSDMDVKLAAALRAQTKPFDDNEDDIKFSPVSCIEQIHELEKNLADEIYAKRFTSYMKKIVGFVGDNCNGLNISYTLVDHFFERGVMMKCSWSGASRTTAIKLAIKNCTNILDTFFAIVRSVNMTFSRQLLEHFFKQITRNAKKRNEAKGLRQPTIHRRAKRQKKAQATVTVASIRSSKSDGSLSTDDDSQSSKSSNSEVSGSEMVVSKVEDWDPNYSSS
ncbi:uncharacterized protein LOC134217971 [Armigeres subalbatus]|uniref:uncharacterized protein LOC134217971 n=1 Tax=Armigeres subalbatus TaxID=124917 RepID=UPI002ED3193D